MKILIIKIIIIIILIFIIKNIFYKENFILNTEIFEDNILTTKTYQNTNKLKPYLITKLKYDAINEYNKQDELDKLKGDIGNKDINEYRHDHSEFIPEELCFNTKTENLNLKGPYRIFNDKICFNTNNFSKINNNYHLGLTYTIGIKYGPTSANTIIDNFEPHNQEDMVKYKASLELNTPPDDTYINFKLLERVFNIDKSPGELPWPAAKKFFIVKAESYTHTHPINVQHTHPGITHSHDDLFTWYDTKNKKCDESHNIDFLFGLWIMTSQQGNNERWEKIIYNGNLKIPFNTDYLIEISSNNISIYNQTVTCKIIVPMNINQKDQFEFIKNAYRDNMYELEPSIREQNKFAPGYNLLNIDPSNNIIETFYDGIEDSFLPRTYTKTGKIFNIDQKYKDYSGVCYKDITKEEECDIIEEDLNLGKYVCDDNSPRPNCPRDFYKIEADNTNCQGDDIYSCSENEQTAPYQSSKEYDNCKLRVIDMYDKCPILNLESRPRFMNNIDVINRESDSNTEISLEKYKKNKFGLLHNKSVYSKLGFKGGCILSVTCGDALNFFFGLTKNPLFYSNSTKRLTDRHRSIYGFYTAQSGTGGIFNPGGEIVHTVSNTQPNQTLKIIYDNQNIYYIKDEVEIYRQNLGPNKTFYLHFSFSRRFDDCGIHTKNILFTPFINNIPYYISNNYNWKSLEATRNGKADFINCTDINNNTTKQFSNRTDIREQCEKTNNIPKCSKQPNKDHITRCTFSKFSHCNTCEDVKTCHTNCAGANNPTGELNCLSTLPNRVTSDGNLRYLCEGCTDCSSEDYTIKQKMDNNGSAGQNCAELCMNTYEEAQGHECYESDSCQQIHSELDSTDEKNTFCGKTYGDYNPCPITCGLCKYNQIIN